MAWEGVFRLDKGESTLSCFGCGQRMRQTGVMGKFWIWLLFLMVFASQACLVIPLPESKVLSGTQITDEDLLFLQPSVTTKADVIGLLGEPTVFWEDENVIAYDWEMRQGILLWAIGGGYSGAAGAMDIPKDYVLLIQFDQNDQLKRFETTTPSPFDSYGEHLLDWIEQQEERESTSSLQENGEKLCIQPSFPRCQIGTTTNWFQSTVGRNSDVSVVCGPLW